MVRSELDDIKNDIESLRSVGYKVNDEVKQLKEDLNIWGLLDEYTIPSIFESKFHKSLINLNKYPYYKQSVNSFNGISKDNLTHLNEEKFRDEIWKKNKILLCTTFLRNSKEFFHAARVASIDTQPILYYYSTVYLFAFLIESFIDFDENKKKHHGLYVNSKGDIANIKFSYAPEKCAKHYVPRGFFERLVNTLSILGYPSSFCSMITDFNDKDYVILREHKTKLSISNTNPILIDDILKYDFRPDRLNINLSWIIYDFDDRYENVSKIIKDFILIYVSSSIARYNPKLWRQIYLGEEKPMIYDLKKSFDNINNMIRLVNNIFKDTEIGKHHNYSRSLFDY
ncbi:MAG: hypothetical protein WAW23_00935 [Candidatus Methanoperedens sp.]